MFGTNTITGKKFFDNAPKDSLHVTSLFGVTIQGEGPFSGHPAIFIRLAKCNLNCTFCFVPSTNITMADGKTKRIDQIQVGDMVMSWDKDKMVQKKVVRTYTSIATQLVKVSILGKPIWCTPEHPFLTSNRGWVNAEHLKKGDVLVKFSMSERMKLFNPSFNSDNLCPMSQHNKDVASDRLRKLWENTEFRENNVKRLTGNTNPMKNPETALKSFINRETRIKSGLEIKIEQICDGLPITYVGSGDLVIQHKIPDFVVNGQKKVIEVWAADSLWVKHRPRDEVWMEKRKALFAKEGYETLFLPLIQSQLKISERHKIREKIAQFIYNGKVVEKVEFVTDGRGWARLYGTKTAERKVYNFEVEDTHTYIANGCVVHNCDAFFDDGDWLTFKEIENKIYETVCNHWNSKGQAVPLWALPQQNNEQTKLGPYPNIVLVITGGEPLLQDNLNEFIRQQLPNFKAIQIESNGIPSTEIPDEVILVCSPKCVEKNGKAIKYLTPSETILNRADCLKFVMSAEKDSPYNEVPQWAHEWKMNTGKEIYCSPMNMYNSFPQKIKLLRAEKGTITMAERSTVDEIIDFFEPNLINMEQVEKNHKYTANYCVNHGFRFNMQLHLFAGMA